MTISSNILNLRYFNVRIKHKDKITITLDIKHEYPVKLYVFSVEYGYGWYSELLDGSE